MNRRSFISTLLGAGAALAIEEAIPFNRVWFFPQRIRLANGGVDWASGPDKIALTFHPDYFNLREPKIGQTITAKKPPRYIFTPAQWRELEAEMNADLVLDANGIVAFPRVRGMGWFPTVAT